MPSRLLLALPLLALSACGGGGGGGNSPPPAASVPEPPAAPSNPAPKPFVDATAASNIDYVTGFTPPSQASLQAGWPTFGGAAAGDCDGDGDVDLFITYGDAGPNRLYLNQLDRGNPLQFADTAAAAGVANTRDDGRGNDRHSGPTFADMDGDGDLDLFVGGLFSDPNKLYENQGNCTFVDRSSESGLGSLGADKTISAAFGDYDLDGDLDLFLAHWGSQREPGRESEHLFRNVSDDQGIRFENVSAASRVTEQLVRGIDNITDPDLRATQDYDPDWTLTPSFARINDDLWPDIALASDYGSAQLLIQDAAVPGTFLDATNDAVRGVEFGMGSALGDYDFDGDLDWFVTSIYIPGAANATGNRLYRNPGGDFSATQYENVTAAAGVADGRWAWAACFLDIDNDTDLDIYHTNGWEEDAVDASRAFIADGDGAFSEEATELGLDDRYNARGIVCADFDNDGDVDILQLTNEPGNSAALWQNASAAAGNNYLRVRLVGLPPNTEAAGARIFARIGSQTQMREIMIGSNFTAQNPTVQIFGLGSAVMVDELRVEWPPLTASVPPQPDPWVSSGVPASASGTTLVICHPELLSAPAECTDP